MTDVRTFVPRGRLAEFVELFWHQDGESGSHPRERVLPTGSAGLVIALGEAPLRVRDGCCGESELLAGATISGARDSWFVIDVASHAASMGMVFRPGGAVPLLGMSAHEFAGRHVPLEAALGSTAGGFRERLREAGTADARFALAERWLTPRAERARRTPAIALGIDRIGRTGGSCRVAELADSAGWSERHFSSVFTREVGLGPKRFARVRRFQSALSMVERGGPARWADIALASGYFDQAHLVREFRLMSGCTPGEYLRRRTAHANHLVA